jgi:hypothetical protein
MAHPSCAYLTCSECGALAHCMAAPACLPARPGSRLPDHGHAARHGGPLLGSLTWGRQLGWGRPPRSASKPTAERCARPAELALRWRALEAGAGAQPPPRWGATFTSLTTAQARL